MNTQQLLDALATARWDLHQTRQKLKETRKKQCHLEASYRQQMKEVIRLERLADADDEIVNLAAVAAEEE